MKLLIQHLIDQYSNKQLREVYRNIEAKENDDTDSVKISKLTINMRDDMRAIYGKGYYISNLYSNLAHYFANKHIEREEIMDIVRGE